MRTPWGGSDYQESLVDGITFYATPSHGGFRLSPEREAELDAKLREHGVTAAEARMGYEPGWYEEDCCAYAVLFAFPAARGGGSPVTEKECLKRLLYWLDRPRRRRSGA